MQFVYNHNLNINIGGNEMSLSMLHCEGEKIINSEGKQVFLRGTNLGGWLLDELWMGFSRVGKPNGIL